MTREEAKELLLHILMTYEPKDQYGDYNDPEPYEQALTMAIEALSAEPTDLISRVELLDRIKAVNSIPWGDDRGNAVKLVWSTEEVKRLIEKAPSADRPSGEWIIRENGNKECSLCGHERQDGWDYFCGYCGAKMRSGGLYYTNDGQRLEWKPVSEGLPQSVGSYIVTCKDEQGLVYVDYDYWTVADEFKYNRDKVTAWIPFPKPYCGAKMGGNK